MTKKLPVLLAIMLVLSLVLGACTPPAQPAQVVEANPVSATSAPVVSSTQAPAEPAAPAVPAATEKVEPAPDFLALFTKLADSIPADKGFGATKPAPLAEELKGNDKPFLLDVREPTEVEKDGFIEGSINIPVRVVLRNLDKLPGLDAKIVVYCGSGHRGGMIMGALRLLGYTNVRNINGGLGAWKKANLPVVSGSKPAEAAKISTAIIADQQLYKALDGFLSVLPEDYFLAKVDKTQEALNSATPPTLIDVRTPDEWTNDGYIKGAVNIPFSDFFKSLDKLPADKTAPLIVTCGSGHRGAMAMMGLRLMGYTDVRNLAGGMGGWKAAKMPVAGWVDWTVAWTDFLKNMPADFYAIKSDVLSRQLADKPPFLLDVREANEIEKDGFIRGSVHIPVREVLKNLDKLPAQDQPIVVYCGSGHRGAMVMSALRQLGYTNVLNLNGGMGAWKKASLPAETGTPTAPTAGKAPEVDSARFRGLNAFLLSLPEDLYMAKAPALFTETQSAAAPVLIDVRTSEEISANGYITNSVSLPIPTLLDDLSKLPADKATPIVTLCQSGHRGSIAMMALRMLGYTNVRNLGGGMNAWAAANLPVVK